MKFEILCSYCGYFVYDCVLPKICDYRNELNGENLKYDV